MSFVERLILSVYMGHVVDLGPSFCEPARFRVVDMVQCFSCRVFVFLM